MNGVRVLCFQELFSTCCILCKACGLVNLSDSDLINPKYAYVAIVHLRTTLHTEYTLYKTDLILVKK